MFADDIYYIYILDEEFLIHYSHSSTELQSLFMLYYTNGDGKGVNIS